MSLASFSADWLCRRWQYCALSMFDCSVKERKKLSAVFAFLNTPVHYTTRTYECVHRLCPSTAVQMVLPPLCSVQTLTVEASTALLYRGARSSIACWKF